MPTGKHVPLTPAENNFVSLCIDGHPPVEAARLAGLCDNDTNPLFAARRALARPGVRSRILKNLQEKMVSWKQLHKASKDVLYQAMTHKDEAITWAAKIRAAEIVLTILSKIHSESLADTADTQDKQERSLDQIARAIVGDATPVQPTQEPLPSTSGLDAEDTPIH